MEPSQNNYALEAFGSGARCFGQDDKWEQKSCTMIKQWTRSVSVCTRSQSPRYGSGCYNFQCAAGQLYIEVRDVSYSCGFRGQRIPIQLQVISCVLVLTPLLQMNSWIHSGSVVCPACSSVCDNCVMEGTSSEVTILQPSSSVFINLLFLNALWSTFQHVPLYHLVE